MTETNQNERKMKEMKRTWKTSAENKEHILQSIPNTKRNKDKNRRETLNSSMGRDVSHTSRNSDRVWTEREIHTACKCAAHAWLPRAYLAGERDVRRGDLQDAGVRRHPRLHRQALAPRHRLALVRQRVHPRPREQRRRRTRGSRRRQLRRLRPRGRLHYSTSAKHSTLCFVIFCFFGECGGMEIGGVVLTNYMIWCFLRR